MVLPAASLRAPTWSGRDRLTVDRLLAEPLMRGSVLLAGPEGDVPITWARSLVDVLASTDQLEGVAVVGQGPVDDADLKDLADRRAAVLVLRGEVAPDWVGRGSAIPVRSLPHGTPDHLIRLAAQLALAHESHTLRYANDVHRSLASLLHRAAGLEALCQQLERITGCSVAYFTPAKEMLAIARDRHDWLDSTTVGQVGRHIIEGLQDEDPRDGLHGPHHSWSVVATMRDREVAVQLCPVDVADRQEGWLLLVADDADPTSHDVEQRSIALEQAVAIIGTEVLRRRSIDRAEERARGNFVHALVHGRFSNHADLVARAAHRQFPVDARFGAVVVSASGLIADHDSPIRLANMAREALRLRGQHDRVALSAVVGDVIAVVREVPEAPRSGQDPAVAELAAYSTALARRLQRQSDRQVLVAYGRPVDGAMAVSDSYREARIALSLGARLGMDSPLSFTDLRVHSTLLGLSQSPEARAFAAELLSPLREASGELCDTIEVYVQAGGNLTQAARDLSVHRNTMLYKLERASKAISRDLREPENQFAVWLALKLDMLAATADDVGYTIDAG